MIVPEIDLISAFILFGALQSLFLSIIFLQSKLKMSLPIISWLLLALAFIEFESFLNYSGFILYTPWFINLSPPLILLLGPLTLLSVKQGLESKVRGQNSFVHFLPALFYFIYSGFFFFQPDEFKLNAVLRSFHEGMITKTISPDFSVDPLNIQGIVVIEGLAVHLLAYVLWSANLVWKARLKIREKRSTSESTRYRWLIFLTTGLLIGGITFLLTGGVINGYVVFKSILPGYAVNLYCVMFAYATTAFWTSNSINAQLNLNKYAKSSLSAEFRQHKLVALRQIMNTQKPFKQADFSLSHLSKLAGMSPHHVSQVINAGTGMTFTDFVNWYRVEEARTVLTSPLSNKIKVEALAHELGYKSKSAFFNAFKRYTDTTPSRFRGLAQ